MNVLILTNGEYGDYEFCKNDGIEQMPYDFVICADRGIRHAIKLGIQPHLIVGDFDSGSQEDLAYYREKHIPIEVFNPMKDETDTELAIKRAVEKGATSITIYGGAGSRLDHTLGNVHLLYTLLKSKIQARLMNPNNTVYMIDECIMLEGKAGDLVSLIPFAGNVKGVTTQNLGYPLEKATLKVGTSLGISNYMTESKASVWIEEGTLLVICARD